MAEYIVMPKLGFDMREGVLNNWLKPVSYTHLTLPTSDLV